MKKEKLLWNTTWLVLRPLLAVFCRYRITGLENIKNVKKPCIFAIATHANILDPYIASIAMPLNNHFYPIRFMTKDVFFKMPVIKHIVRAYGTFPVIRGLGLEKTLEPAIQLIKQGHPVGIFVEGKISPHGELREAKPGAAALALMTGIPVIPVALKGTHLIRHPLKWLFLQKKVCVSFAKPIYVDRLNAFDSSKEETKNHINKLTKTIHAEIKQMH